MHQRRETRHSPVQSITIEPSPRHWDALIEDAQTSKAEQTLFGESLQSWSIRSRNELGIQECSTVIGTGHQAAFWHPGILAKYLAAEAFADVHRKDLHVSPPSILELVVDQDTNDPLQFRAPAKSKKNDALVVQDIVLGNATNRERYTELPLASCPPVEPKEIESRGAGAATCLLEAALGEQATHANTLAEQVTFANQQIRQSTFSKGGQSHVATNCATVYATALPTTSLWKHLLKSMLDDPIRMAKAYNAAVSEFPNAKMKPLEITADSIELPVWIIDEETGDRNHAFAHDFDSSDGAENISVWPRALLMTGLVRLLLVDVFIHGLGGKNYDQVTEHWFKNWLGVTLAPMVAVSADVWLDFGITPASPEDIHQARWYRHHLQYNLDRESESKSARNEAKKRALLDRINELPRRSAARYAAYLELQVFQEDLREKHANVLSAADNEIKNREQAHEHRRIIEDRTWAFPLYPKATLQELDRQIRRRFAEFPSIQVPPVADPDQGQSWSHTNSTLGIGTREACCLAGPDAKGS